MLKVLINTTFRFDPSYGSNVTGSNIIDVIVKGAIVEDLGEYVDGWSKVKHNGMTGYIISKFLKKMDT